METKTAQAMEHGLDASVATPTKVHEMVKGMGASVDPATKEIMIFDNKGWRCVGRFVVVKCKEDVCHVLVHHATADFFKARFCLNALPTGMRVCDSGLELKFPEVSASCLASLDRMPLYGQTVELILSHKDKETEEDKILASVITIRVAREVIKVPLCLVTPSYLQSYYGLPNKPIGLRIEESQIDIPFVDGAQSIPDEFRPILFGKTLLLISPRPGHMSFVFGGNVHKKPFE